MSKGKRWQIKVDRGGGLSTYYIWNRDGEVYCAIGNGMPQSLSNVFGDNAMEARFQLEVAATGTAAAKLLRKYTDFKVTVL